MNLKSKDIFSKPVRQLENSWSVSVRQMWGLPLNTHKYFVEPLGGVHQTWQFGSPKFGLTSKFDPNSVISYRINFGWIIIRHFYFDLISMEVNTFSDFDLNFGGHSWTWIEAMKGFQEQMVSALAFKPDHFIKTVEHEPILLQTLLIDNINFHVSEFF